MDVPWEGNFLCLIPYSAQWQLISPHPSPQKKWYLAWETVFFAHGDPLWPQVLHIPDVHMDKEVLSQGLEHLDPSPLNQFIVFTFHSLSYIYTCSYYPWHLQAHIKHSLGLRRWSLFYMYIKYFLYICPHCACYTVDIVNLPSPPCSCHNYETKCCSMLLF